LLAGGARHFRHWELQALGQLENPAKSKNNKVNGRLSAENAGQGFHLLTSLKNRALTNLPHR
jgi:hypothetical protein